MQIRVITKTRAKRPGVTHLTGQVYEVAVAAAPINGKANQAVVEMVAEYFGLKKSQVHIVAGLTTTHKTIELLELS